MTKREVQLVPLVDRLNILFKIWQSDKGFEQASDSVAAAVVDAGGVADSELISAIRTGRLTPTDTQLTLIARHFGIDPRYLTSERGHGMHEQFVLLLTLKESGVKGIYLRGGSGIGDLPSLADVVRSARRDCITASADVSA
ncbi:hypothetical protein HQO27_01735 [Rhodococcus fascians]|nr:hypothetical protein [Rhodococcus fascians]MBY4237819.1 hypothetical protein [Rhodococcus fascians]MBY4253430.1 hypothetical protein [Rhodococcus fascians]MBY4269067.1 hypothetical protein [Rhodococcus fascians]MBY4275122.1 hypothetical protein [Rhodococcus fascians]